MEMTNIPVKLHAHLSKADDNTNNCVNIDDNDINGNNNNNNNNNDSSNKKRIHDSCPQNQQESQHIQSMQALQHQQHQKREEEECSGWTVGDHNRVDSSFIGGTTTGTGAKSKSTSPSASEAIDSNKRRRYRRQKSSSLTSVHTNNPPVITSCHDDDEYADLDDYGSWCGGSKDVTSLTSKETIGGRKDEEEEEEVMDLTVDDYLKEDYDTHESFSRNDGDGVTFVASGGQTKNSMEYSDVDNDDNDENSNSCYSEWNDSERMTLERQDHEQSFIDAAANNNSQQDWDGYTIRNNAFTTSGWVLNRHHQPPQKENFHLRSLPPSMSSSLSLLSNVSVQTVVSSSSSSSSCNDEGKNNQNQRSSSRGEKMGFGRHTPKKTAVIAINDSDQLNHEMEKLIHRTEDWSLFHVRKRILLQQQLQQEEQHQFHQKQEQCDKDTFVNPSPSTTMTHNANDSDKNSILDQRNNNQNNNSNNSINAAAIQRALPSSSLTSSLLSVRTKQQVHSARRNVIRTFMINNNNSKNKQFQ